MDDLLGNLGDGQPDDEGQSGDVLGSLSGSNPPSQPGSALDSMLADQDDDDLFSAPAAPPEQPSSSQPPSALIAWQREKDAELQGKDAEEAAKADGLKAEARSAADNFVKTIADAQHKRAVHNKELDDQKKADLESQAGTQWEKVVKFIDFNRSDLHERDVAKFKSLLLQLKH
jgi:hypothetical protein